MTEQTKPRFVRVFVGDATTAPPQGADTESWAGAAVTVTDAIDTFLAAVDDRSVRDRRGQPYDRTTARDLRWCLAGHVREALGAMPSTRSAAPTSRRSSRNWPTRVSPNGAAEPSGEPRARCTTTRSRVGWPTRTRPVASPWQRTERSRRPARRHGWVGRSARSRSCSVAPRSAFCFSPSSFSRSRCERS